MLLNYESLIDRYFFTNRNCENYPTSQNQFELSINQPPKPVSSKGTLHRNSLLLDKITNALFLQNVTIFGDIKFPVSSHI